MNTTEPAILCEIGPEPSLGRLRLVSVAIFHKDLPVPLTVSTLEEACAVARARGWTLAPIPANEEWRPENCRNLTDEAWATVNMLMAK